MVTLQIRMCIWEIISESYTVCGSIIETLFNRKEASGARRSARVDAQADLELHCLHMVEELLWHDTLGIAKAHLLLKLT